MGKGAVGDLRQNVRDLLLFRECGNSPKSVRFPTNPVGCWQVYIYVYTNYGWFYAIDFNCALQCFGWQYGLQYTVDGY